MNENCRVCLIAKEKNDFKDVLNKIADGKTILQIIMECAPIEILRNDPLPKVVCLNCSNKLHSFYELRNLILNSDITLKESLSKLEALPCKYEILEEKGECNSTICDSKNLKDYSKKGKPINSTEVKVVSQKQDVSIISEALGNINKNRNSEFTDHNDPISIINTTECVKEGENTSKKSPMKPTRKSKRIHECKECNKVFKKAGHYSVHMTKHTGEKKYACEFCPKRFANSYVLVYHRRVHTGERPYTCNICSKSFSFPSSFYTHKKIHTGERNFKCDICSESFIQLESLKIHVRKIHTGERPFLCEICSSAFRSNGSLLTHKLDMHGKKEACPICDQVYSSRVLKEHIRRHKEREQGIKRFVCDQCGKKFTCSSSRKKHLLIHSGEKPFSCEICNKSFNQRSALKTHARVHSDFMPFPCDYCSKSFRYKHHLRSHINNHHKDVVEDAINK